MRMKLQKRVDTLNRVTVFGANHSEFFPAGSVAGDSLNVIAGAVARLAAGDQSLLGGGDAVRKSRGCKVDAYSDLRDCLFTISRVAKGQKLNTFFMPLSRAHSDLLTVGKRWLTEAEQYRDLFAKCAMPNIIERLKASVNNLEGGINGETSGQDARKTAASDIERPLAAAFEALASLDPVMEHLLADNPALESWHQVRRVERPRKARSSVARGPDSNAGRLASPAQQPATAPGDPALTTRGPDAIAGGPDAVAG